MPSPQRVAGECTRGRGGFAGGTPPFAESTQHLYRAALLPTVGGLFILACLAVAVDREIVNACAPVLLAVLCLVGLVRLVRSRLVEIVISPIAWFLMACSVYYGIGPLLYVYGNDVSIAQANDFYYVDTAILWKTNILNIVSVLGVLLCTLLFMGTTWRPSLRSASMSGLKKAGFWYCFLGISCTLLVAALRMLNGPDYVIPGVLMIFGRCLFGGVFLYALLYFRKVPNVTIPFLGATVVACYMAITSLMKQQIYELGLVIFMGYFLSKPSFTKILVAGVLTILTIPVVNTATAFARMALWSEGAGKVSAAELYATIRDKEGMATFREINRDDQSIWRRLSYSPSQAFAIDAYDSGVPGNSFQTVWWSLVPRILFPQKPIISYGTTFTSLVKGSGSSNSTCPGFFGEAYWNLGWLGIAVMSVVLGGLLSQFAHFNWEMVASGAFQYFPLGFLALMFGYRVDDWFAATTFNSLAFIGVLFCVGKLLSR